jgi:hypothetical protein
MIRSVWLAFAFLVFIGALAVFRAGVATAPKLEAIAADVVEADLAQDVLPKADRLDDASDPKPVQALAIVPPVPAAAQPQEKTTKIISRHWRDSYAKVKNRKHHGHHATHSRASHQKKYRRSRH